MDEFRPDDVLPALATVEGEIRDTCLTAAGGPGEEGRVLIVGVRPGVQKSGRGLKALQHLGGAGRAEVVDRANLSTDWKTRGCSRSCDRTCQQCSKAPAHVERIAPVPSEPG